MASVVEYRTQVPGNSVRLKATKFDGDRIYQAGAGACHGAGSFPPEAIAAIDAQGLRLAALAGELLALRDGYGREAR